MSQPNNQQNLRDMIKLEYQRCLADAVYFIKKYCYIQHPQRGRIKFELYPFQEDTLQQLQHNDKNIILKSRQLGISTLSAGYSLWLAMFHRDKSVLVIATRQEVAKNLITKVREMYQHLPNWLKQQVDTEENNKLSIRFKNGSQVKAISSSTEGARSESISLLVIDEAAFIDKIEDLWASAQQTIATGGKCIILSTPNGVGNWFHKMWRGAEEKRNGFNSIKLHWTVHPERNQKWRDDQTLELGDRLARQECDTSFESSGHTVIPAEILSRYRNEFVSEPKERRGFDKELWIWEYPDFTKNYIVVADVARGDGDDFSAFHVIDIETITQVAEYQGKLNTKDFGNFLVNVATEYNDALLVIENANIGWAAIQEVIDRDYKNIYYTSKDIRYIDSTVLERGYDMKDKSQMVPGFSTTSKTRPLIIAKMELYFREGICIPRSSRLINELEVFSWINGKAQAQNGYHDDLVMCYAIAMWIRDTALKLQQEGIELTKQSLGSFSSSKPVSAVYTPKQMGNNPWQMKNSQGGMEDLTWLIR